MSANFELYKIFYYVAEYSNITHAANELCLTQPGVTKAIHNLENQLGVQLFIRTRRGVKLTAEGAVLFRQIQPACKAFLAAETNMSRKRYQEHGTVRISANDLVVKLVLLPAIEKFREYYPNVSLNITRTPPSDVSTALTQGILDLAIEFDMDMKLDSQSHAETNEQDISIVNVSAVRNSEINTTVLGTYYDLPIVGPNLGFLSRTELTIPDLFEYPLIIPSQDTVARSYYSSLFKQYGLSRRVDIEASGVDRRILLTEQNMGISFMPKECIQSEIAQKRLFPLKLNQKLLERKLLLMTSKNRTQSSVAKAFCQMLT